MEKRLLYLAIALAFVLGAFVGLSLRRAKPGPDVDPESPRDTCWLHDTLLVQLPAPKAKAIHDTCWLTVPLPEPPDTSSHRPDTVYVPVPIESNYYADEGWEAWVSGYKASLDSLRIHQATAVVEVPAFKTVTKRARWGLGLQAGATYNLSKDQNRIQPYIGVGLSYNIITF